MEVTGTVVTFFFFFLSFVFGLTLDQSQEIWNFRATSTLGGVKTGIRLNRICSLVLQDSVRGGQQVDRWDGFFALLSSYKGGEQDRQTVTINQ